MCRCPLVPGLNSGLALKWCWWCGCQSEPTDIWVNIEIRPVRDIWVNFESLCWWCGCQSGPTDISVKVKSRRVPEVLVAVFFQLSLICSLIVVIMVRAATVMVMRCRIRHVQSSPKLVTKHKLRHQFAATIFTPNLSSLELLFIWLFNTKTSRVIFVTSVTSSACVQREKWAWASNAHAHTLIRLQSMK